MRRCKHFYKYTWCYEDYVTRQIEKASGVQCMKCRLPYVWDGISSIPCLLEGGCPYYTPVEVDPYWKDIVDETNRRLYGNRK